MCFAHLACRRSCRLKAVCALVTSRACADCLAPTHFPICYLVHFGRRVPPKIHQEATMQCNWGDFHPDRSLSSVTSHSCKLIRLSEMLKLGKPRSPPQKIPNSQSVAFHGLAPRRHLHNGARKHPLRLDILNTARPVARMLSLDHPSRPSNFETSSRVLNPSRTSGFESSSRLLDLAATHMSAHRLLNIRCCQRAHEEACSPRSWRVHGLLIVNVASEHTSRGACLFMCGATVSSPGRRFGSDSANKCCNQVRYNPAMFQHLHTHFFDLAWETCTSRSFGSQRCKVRREQPRRISLRFPNPRPLAFPTSVGHPRVVMRKRSRPCPLPHIDSTSSTLLTCTEY